MAECPRRFCPPACSVLTGAAWRQLCAGFASGAPDTCQGDSGGPLFLASGPTVVGIVSYSGGCAQPDTPGVYVRVSAYLGWIYELAGDELPPLAFKLDNPSPPPPPPPPPQSPPPPSPPIADQILSLGLGTVIGIAAGALCCVLLTIGLLVKFVCMPAVKVWSHPHPAETQTGVYTDGHAGLHHLHAAGDAVIMMAHHAPDGKVTMTPAPHGTNLQHTVM